jgi:NTP pyrophosphatase (non-canonical NTP hydrolase)
MEPMGLRAQAETVIRRMIDEVHRLNVAKGWYEHERTAGDECALLHSEISEILDAYRNHGFEDVTATTKYAGGKSDGLTVHKPIGVGSEVADLFIRLLDVCKRWDIDLIAEYDRKMAYNQTRPYRHGQKRL